MSSNLLTPKQRMGPTLGAVSKSKRREKNEAPLILAILIGVCAALGIVLLAGNDSDGTAPHREQAPQLSGAR